MSETRGDMEATIVQAVSHEVRRTILRIVGSGEKGASYTEIITELGISTGQINYHLKQLEGLLEKSADRKYVLTPLGRRAVAFIDSITAEDGREYERYVKAAQAAQRSSIYPAFRWLLYIAMAFMALFVAMWGFLFYIAVSEGAPLIVYVVLPILLALGVAALVWLAYTVRRAPSYIKWLERGLFRGV